MVQFHQSNELKFLNALDGAVIGTSTTTDGEAIDTKGYNSLTFVIRSSAYTDGTFTPLIEESDTGDFGGEETAVDDAFLGGSDETTPEASAAITAANTVEKIPYLGKKRYVRLTVVSAGVSSGAHISGLAILGHARSAPVA